MDMAVGTGLDKGPHSVSQGGRAAPTPTAPAVALSHFFHHLSFASFEYIPWVSFLGSNGTSVFITFL